MRFLGKVSHFKYSMFLDEVFFHFSFHLFNIDWDIWFLIKLNDMEIISVFDKVCPSFAIKSAFSLPGICMWPGIHCRFMKNPIFLIILMFFRMSRVIPVHMILMKTVWRRLVHVLFSKSLLWLFAEKIYMTPILINFLCILINKSMWKRLF